MQALTKLKSKKAQTQGAVGTVIALIVGVGVAVLVLLFVGILGGNAYDLNEDTINEIGNNIVTGDTFTIYNNTDVELDYNDVQTGTLVIFNNTAPYTVIGLGNFTIDYDNGKVKYLDYTNNGGYNETVCGANYTWGRAEVQSSIENSIVSGFSALEDTGDYLPLIVLGIVIFLILGLVLGMMNITRGGGMAL